MGLLKPLLLDPRQKVRLTKISIWDFYLDSSYLCKITVGFEIWRQASQQPAKTSIWSSVCRSIMILITYILCHTIHFIHKLRHCIFHPILIHKYLLLKISCLLFKHHNQRTENTWSLILEKGESDSYYEISFCMSGDCKDFEIWKSDVCIENEGHPLKTFSWIVIIW